MSTYMHESPVRCLDRGDGRIAYDVCGDGTLVVCAPGMVTSDPSTGFSPRSWSMGASDPDFPDPGGEARIISDRLDAEVLTVPDAGHYPQTEFPEVVAPAILRFLDRLSHAAP